MLIVGGAAYQLFGRHPAAGPGSGGASQPSVQRSEWRTGGGQRASGAGHDSGWNAGSERHCWYRFQRHHLSRHAGAGLHSQPPSTTQVRISRSSFSGYRDPQPIRDSAYVFIAGASGTGIDDAWVPLGHQPGFLVGVVPRGCWSRYHPHGFERHCSVRSGSRDADTHLRGHAASSSTESEGHSWLGARSVSGGEALQPVVGPLADDTGFRLDYLDGRGMPTADLTAIKNIRFTVQGVSAEAVRSGGGQPLRAEDGLTAQVALRNASWP